ncbi:hypothetical protein EVA_05028 [gut metagenome]|uniref:Uncharacterized protein n=1 Tax=gut metagenome TaxID=749906 RepID=J9H0M2_9ZZZZ
MAFIMLGYFRIARIEVNALKVIFVLKIKMVVHHNLLSI